jgi:FecR protein
MKHVWSVALTVGVNAAILALGAVSASAQPVISAKSGLVAYVEGKVFVGDQLVAPSLTSFPDVKENMVLRTTEEGRAEILLSPGVFLRVGENSSFRMITNRLIDTRLEILTGSAVVEADEMAKDTNVTIVANQASVLIAKHGLYRFDMEPARVKVFDGVASVTTGEQTMPVGPGRMLSLDSKTASVEKFNKEDTDALDRWSRRRAGDVAMANVSSAKQVHDYGCTSYGANWANAASVPVNSPCYNPCGGWRINQWFGIVTYIPCGTNIYSPYGYRYWSPINVARVYYVAPPVSHGGGYGNGGGYYPSMGSSGGGYSGAVATSGSSMGSSAGAMSSSGSSAASSAGASSAGHGGGGGGHGK